MASQDEYIEEVTKQLSGDAAPTNASNKSKRRGTRTMQKA